MRATFTSTTAIVLLWSLTGFAGEPTTRPVEETHVPETSFARWLLADQLTGDWGGGRSWLADQGLAIDIGYTADYSFNTRGGLNTERAQEYRGLLDVSFTFDSEALGLWNGGTAFVNFQTHHGPDPTERHVGDVQAFSNIDAPDYAEVSEYWYEHALLDGKVRVKAGKMDANADFAYVDFGGEFINSSPGFSPTIPLPTFPDPVLGVALFLEPVDWFYAGAGVYDALGSGRKWGFGTALHAPDDSFTIFEIGLKPTFRVAGAELPGRYGVGGWYHSGVFEEFFDDLGGRLSARQHRGNAGLYLVFDQLLYREQPEVEDDDQGLGAFFQFGWAPSLYNEITRHYGAGVVYTGPLPSRDADMVGLMMSHVSLSGRVQALEGRHSETAIELFYKWQITPAVSLKPDLHYIISPGGDGRDAVVATLRLEVSF